MNDVSHVWLVDSHAEGNRGDNKLDLPFAPVVVSMSPIFGFEPCMVKRDLVRLSSTLKTECLDQFVCRLFAVLFGQTVQAQSVSSRHRVYMRETVPINDARVINVFSHIVSNFGHELGRLFPDIIRQVRSRVLKNG